MAYNVPCGRTMGHGEACSVGYLCDACETIDKLTTEIRNLETHADVLAAAVLRRDDRINELEQRIHQHSKEGNQL